MKTSNYALAVLAAASINEFAWQFAAKGTGEQGAIRYVTQWPLLCLVLLGLHLAFRNRFLSAVCVAVDTTSAALTNNSSFNNRTDSGTLLEDGQAFIGSQYVKGGTTQLKGAKSIGVTGATTIYTAANNNYQTMLVVSGDTGAAGFSDIIIFAFGTISTVHSSTRYGAPAARTYTAPGAGVIQLAMAAGTYSCKVSALENQ